MQQSKYQKLQKTPQDMKTNELLQYKRTRVFGLSQDEFSKKFDVPLGTLRNWEQGLSSPPSYFMKFLDDEEALLSADMATPIEQQRRTREQSFQMSDRHQLLKAYALDNIEGNELQKEAYDMIEELVKPNGFAENLQSIYPYFDNSSVSDLSLFMMLALLKRIDSKLDKLIGD